MKLGCQCLCLTIRPGRKALDTKQGTVMGIKNDVLLSADILVYILPVSYRELSYCTVKRIRCFVSIRKHSCKKKLWELGCLSYNPTHSISSYITSFLCAFVLLALKTYENRSLCFIERIWAWDEHVRQSGICRVLSSSNCWSCNLSSVMFIATFFPTSIASGQMGWTHCLGRTWWATWRGMT